jgi:tRNA dimethylallyltransferase
VGGWGGPASPAPPPATRTAESCEQRRGALIVGGTAFYVRALFEEYTELQHPPDPELRRRLEQRERTEGLHALAQELTARAPDLAQTIDLKNPVRVRRALEKLEDPSPPIAFRLPPFAKHKFVLQPPTDSLDQAIQARVHAMFSAGWVQEVQQLLDKGVPRTAPAFRAIGYDTVIDLIEGRLGEDEAKSRIATSTRQYAKRQRTWLRSEPNARIVPTHDADQAINLICNALQSG